MSSFEHGRSLSKEVLFGQSHGLPVGGKSWPRSQLLNPRMVLQPCSCPMSVTLLSSRLLTASITWKSGQLDVSITREKTIRDLTTFNHDSHRFVGKVSYARNSWGNFHWLWFLWRVHTNSRQWHHWSKPVLHSWHETDPSSSSSISQHCLQPWLLP